MYDAHVYSCDKSDLLSPCSNTLQQQCSSSAATPLAVILILWFLCLTAACVPVCTAAKVSQRLIRYRRSLMIWTDKRVGLMNEIVNSIQMIKFYAWETSFKAAVMDVRNKEAGILKRMVWVQSLFAMLLFSGPVMMAVAVFAGKVTG